MSIYHSFLRFYSNRDEQLDDCAEIIALLTQALHAKIKSDGVTIPEHSGHQHLLITCIMRL